MKSFKRTPFFRFICYHILISFFVTGMMPVSPAQARSIELPAPTAFIPLSDHYSFPVLKALKLDPKNPLNIEFVIDTADNKDVTNEEVSALIRYFLAALTIPEEDIWVNLSPYEDDKIAPTDLASTDLGKDLLSQDYILKQLLSSLTYPESNTGKDFWSKAYDEILQIAKTTKLPVNTFNKIWIVPESANVYENGTTAMITDARLKVMLEEDYLALKNKVDEIMHEDGVSQDVVEKVNDAASKVMREVVLPKINRDVNDGKNFATLRQIYHSLILGLWFKKKFADSLYRYYIDKGKITGIDLEDKNAKEKIYDHYVKAFQKGLYNYTKREYDPGTQRQIKRRYYSGGFSLLSPDGAAWMTVGDVLPMHSSSPIEYFEGNAKKVLVGLTNAGASGVTGSPIEEKVESTTQDQEAENVLAKIKNAVTSLRNRFSSSPMVKDESILNWSMNGKSLKEVLDKIVKEYDIRGFDGYGDEALFPRQIDEELLVWIGRALGSTPFTSSVHGQTVSLKPGDWYLVGGDNGLSTEIFRENIIQGLRETGINIIDLGVLASGELYSNISRFGVAGGLYITRSHVEIGTNGLKPVIGGITLYGAMLEAIKTQILSGTYRKARRMGKLDTSRRQESRRFYIEALTEEFKDLKTILDELPIKIAVNLAGGSAVGYGDLFRTILGEHLVDVLREKSDPYNEEGGLADPTRKDAKALAHEKANIVQYSEKNPDVLVINFDLDADRVSVLWGGNLYLGDDEFLPIIDYQLSIDKYGIGEGGLGFNDTIYIDSRMSNRTRDLTESLGGIAKLHPKGHSKVKATMDIELRNLAKRLGLTVDEFLKKYPDYINSQPEYSLHMFLTDKYGKPIDDALRFSLFWIRAFSKIREKYNQPAWTMADYISYLEKEGMISPTVQLKEQRTPMPEDAKKKVMLQMEKNLVDWFEGKGNFALIKDWRSFSGKEKPFTLVEVDGVFHLMSPIGDAFWGWSNTSPKDAFGVQSSNQENLKKLSQITLALWIHSRSQAAKELGMVLPRINDTETAMLRDIFGYERVADGYKSPSSDSVVNDVAKEIEEVCIKKYPRLEDALSALENSTASSPVDQVDEATGLIRIAKDLKKTTSSPIEQEGYRIKSASATLEFDSVDESSLERLAGYVTRHLMSYLVENNIDYLTTNDIFNYNTSRKPVTFFQDQIQRIKLPLGEMTLNDKAKAFHVTGFTSEDASQLLIMLVGLIADAQQYVTRRFDFDEDEILVSESSDVAKGSSMSSLSDSSLTWQGILAKSLAAITKVNKTSSPIQDMLVSKLSELRKNSGLPISLDPSNIKVLEDSSVSSFWADAMRALYFDAPVYRRVERVKDNYITAIDRILFKYKDHSVFVAEGWMVIPESNWDSVRSELKEAGITITDVDITDLSKGFYRKDFIETCKIDERNSGNTAFNDAFFDTDIDEITKYDVSIAGHKFYSTRTGERMNLVLMDKNARATDEAYFMHRGIFASRKDIQKAFYDNKIRFDITIIPPALWGREFSKTTGHFHAPVNMPEIYQVVSGEALWIMQRTEDPNDTTSPVIDFVTVRAKAGDIVIMLPGYGHVSVNVSETEPLVMADWLTWNQASAYGSFKDKRGAAYYVAKDDTGNIVFSPNHEYIAAQGVLPPVRQMQAKDAIPEFGLMRGVPIYNLVKLPDEELARKVAFLNHPENYKDLLTVENTLEEVSQEKQVVISDLSGPKASSPIEKKIELRKEQHIAMPVPLAHSVQVLFDMPNKRQIYAIGMFERELLSTVGTFTDWESYSQIRAKGVGAFMTQDGQVAVSLPGGEIFWDEKQNMIGVQSNAETPEEADVLINLVGALLQHASYKQLNVINRVFVKSAYLNGGKRIPVQYDFMKAFPSFDGALAALTREPSNVLADLKIFQDEQLKERFGDRIRFASSALSEKTMLVPHKRAAMENIVFRLLSTFAVLVSKGGNSYGMYVTMGNWVKIIDVLTAMGVDSTAKEIEKYFSGADADEFVQFVVGKIERMPFTLFHQEVLQDLIKEYGEITRNSFNEEIISVDIDRWDELDAAINKHFGIVLTSDEEAGYYLDGSLPAFIKLCEKKYNLVQKSIAKEPARTSSPVAAKHAQTNKRLAIKDIESLGVKIRLNAKTGIIDILEFLAATELTNSVVWEKTKAPVAKQAFIDVLKEVKAITVELEKVLTNFDEETDQMFFSGRPHKLNALNALLRKNKLKFDASFFQGGSREEFLSFVVHQKLNASSPAQKELKASSPIKDSRQAQATLDELEKAHSAKTYLTVKAIGSSRDGKDLFAGYKDILGIYHNGGGFVDKEMLVKVIQFDREEYVAGNIRSLVFGVAESKTGSPIRMNDPEALAMRKIIKDAGATHTTKQYAQWVIIDSQEQAKDIEVGIREQLGAAVDADYLLRKFSSPGGLFREFINYVESKMPGSSSPLSHDGREARHAGRDNVGGIDFKEIGVETDPESIPIDILPFDIQDFTGFSFTILKVEDVEDVDSFVKGEQQEYQYSKRYQ